MDIRKWGYPQFSDDQQWNMDEYGTCLKMLGERAHFFWSFVKFKHYRYPLEKAISTCLSSQIFLWFAAAFSAIFWPWESQSVGHVLYVLLSYSNYYIIRFTDWLLNRSYVWRDVDSSIYWHWLSIFHCWSLWYYI